MALTDAQMSSIRFYAGWSGRYHSTDTRLETAMRAVAEDPTQEALITNALTASPPGLLACLADIDAKLTAAHGRLKADAVGSITLNRRELGQLVKEGQRHVRRLVALLGVERRADVFGGGAGSTSNNWIGK